MCSPIFWDEIYSLKIDKTSACTSHILCELTSHPNITGFDKTNINSLVVIFSVVPKHFCGCMAGRSKHVTCLLCEIPDEGQLRNFLVEVLEKKWDNVLCSVEHRNTWVPHGHNLSCILYICSTIKQHKLKNSCIWLPLGGPFFKALDYRKHFAM